MPTIVQMAMVAGLALGAILAVVARILREEPHEHGRPSPRQDNAITNNRTPSSSLPQCVICEDKLHTGTTLIKVRCCANMFHKECYEMYQSVLMEIKGYYLCPSCQRRQTS